MSIGSRMRDRREALGLTQVQLAKLLGVTKGAIGNYETGANSPRASLMYKVFEVLRCDANYLFQDEIAELETDDFTVPEIKMIKKYRKLDDLGKKAIESLLDIEYQRVEPAPESQAEDEDEVELDPENGKIIKLVFVIDKASAGPGFYLGDEQQEVWKVRENRLTSRADFCVEVDGHSMEPKLHNGDIVLIKKVPVDVGEIGLFIVNRNGYVKKKGPHGLISINPNSDDIPVGKYDEFHCSGKVIGVLDPEWIVER